MAVEDVQYLADNFDAFAKHCLSVRTKEGSLNNLKFNKAQEFLHSKLEEQRLKTGKVRALILKGRQQGCSTYVAARFYHKAIHNMGQKVFIIAHRDDATNNLFKMVNRFHEYCPEYVKPVVGKSNAKELSFTDVESSYAVGTSGGGTVGRSDTIQLLHGSEVAYWENTEEISSGVMQTVPDMKGTEIILESTANGMGNMFYRMCMAALRGEGEYQLVFIPWYWQDEYKKELPKDFSLTEEESKYKEAYKLTDEQIYWRRIKIGELDGGDWQFKQEYPANVQEAFQTSGADSLIKPEFVLRARKTSAPRTDSGLLIGVDPAGEGKDTIGIVLREGRIVTKAYRLQKKTVFDNITMQIVAHVAQLIDNHNPLMVFIDKIGIGTGVCDRLSELGYREKIVRVNAGERLPVENKYFNMRAQMWGKMNDWFQDEPCQIPDDESLHADLTSPQWSYDSNRRILLESKDDMKKRGIPSPDLGDALALTFAYNYYKLDDSVNRQNKSRTAVGSISLMDN